MEFELRGGELYARCTNKRCKKLRPVNWFVPKLSPRDADAFKRACIKYERAAEAGADTDKEDALDVIKALKSAKCERCREVKSKSQYKGPNNKEAACRRAWQELKATRFAACGKCGGTRAIEANHFDPKGEIDPKNKKVDNVSTFTHWASHGGIPAMHAEADKCEPLCRMCHTIEDTSNAGNRNENPETYPVVRWCVDPKAYDKRRNASIRYPKHQYVDGIKRALGGCMNLNCPRDGPPNALRDFPQCFDFDHLVEAHKGDAVAAIVRSNKRGHPSVWMAQINDEVRKCQLLCRNCHFLKTLHNLVIERMPDAERLALVETAIHTASAAPTSAPAPP